MLSTPRTIYGIHSVTLFDRVNYLPFGIMKVLGSLSFDFTGDFNDLFGGSSRYAWDSEAGVLSSDISLNIKEFPSFIYQKALGASVTDAAAESAGNVGTIVNKFGSSLVAATGVLSATAKSGSETDLKDGLLILKAVSATEVDAYYMSDVDMNQGTNKTFEDDALKITATPLTIATSTAVEIPGFGIEITGGAGTIAMTIGDTAYCFVRKINDGSSVISIGQSTADFEAFGMLITSQKKGSGDTFEMLVHKAKGIGLPHSLTEAEWMTSDITIRALYDAAQNEVAQFRHVKAA